MYLAGIEQIYYEDTDCLGMVYHANYLKFAERVRSRWLQHYLAPDALQLLANRQLAFVVSNININFRQPGYLADRLYIDLLPIKIGYASMLVQQLVYRIPLCQPDLPDSESDNKTVNEPANKLVNDIVNQPSKAKFSEFGNPTTAMLPLLQSAAQNAKLAKIFTICLPTSGLTPQRSQQINLSAPNPSKPITHPTLTQQFARQLIEVQQLMAKSFPLLAKLEVKLALVATTNGQPLAINRSFPQLFSALTNFTRHTSTVTAA